MRATANVGLSRQRPKAIAGSEQHGSTVNMVRTARLKQRDSSNAVQQCGFEQRRFEQHDSSSAVQAGRIQTGQFEQDSHAARSEPAESDQHTSHELDVRCSVAGGPGSRVHNDSAGGGEVSQEDTGDAEWHRQQGGNLGD